MAFWLALAEDTDRTVTLDLAGGPLPVAVGAEELAAAVDAVLGNVFAHTPDGSAFAVRLIASDRGAELTVVDDGPGLAGSVGAPAGWGVSAGASTGLGLDIASRPRRRPAGCCGWPPARPAARA